MISKALSLINTASTSITYTNTEVQNFYMNILNDYQSFMRTSNSLYTSDLISETDN